VAEERLESEPEESASVQEGSQSDDHQLEDLELTPAETADVVGGLQSRPPPI
jgi:hypothetical protein